LLDKAIELDPEYAAAYAYLSGSYLAEIDADWGGSRGDAIKNAIAYAHKAVSLDDFDAGNHAAMGAAYMYQKKFELAEVHLDRAIECNPNSYGAFCAKCWVLTLSGRASEVMDCGNTALQLNPLAPDDCLLAIIIAHYLERKYDAALEMIARVRVPYAISEVCRAACLVQLGRDDEARNAAISAVEMGGNINEQGEYFRSWPLKNPNDLEHLMDGLHKSVVLLESSE
jgi:adenylate cyclase